MSRTTKLGAAAVAAAVVVLVGFWFLVNGVGGGPETAASDFFATIQSRGAQAAYATASPAFRSATPADVFASTAQADGLTGYQSSSWTKSGETGGVAQLTGVLNLRGGGVLAARVALVRGADGWSVLSVNLPTGASTDVQAASSQDPEAASTRRAASNMTSTSSSNYGYPPPAASGPSRAGMIGGEGSPTAQTPPVQERAPARHPASAPIVVTSGEVARLCGLDIRRHGPVETLDVHCAHGLRAVHGATAQCMAEINGDRQEIGAVLDGYDPVSGRSDVRCHSER